MGRGGSGKRRASSGSRKPRSSGNPSSDDGSVFNDGHLAVTLSGGGVRSAAVSSGVLCFLKEVGVIDKVSVSRGPLVCRVSDLALASRGACSC